MLSSKASEARRKSNKMKSNKVSSTQIAAKYKVSLRTAQRWLKQGFNEIVNNDCDTKRQEAIQNDRILNILETQNRLIENQTNLMQTMLELIVEIKNDRQTTRNDNIVAKNDISVAISNTSEILTSKPNGIKLEGTDVTKYDNKRHEMSLSVALEETANKEKKEEKGKEKFPLIYPPYKEKEKEERKESITPIIPLADKELNQAIEKKQTVNEYSSDFIDFWNIYPRRATDSKYKSYQAYLKASKENGFNQEQLLLAVENYKKLKQVQEGYQKGAAVFLNGKMYQEEHLVAKNVTSYKAPKEAEQARIAEIMELYSQLSRLEAIEKAGDAFIEGYGFKDKNDIQHTCFLIRQKINILNQELTNLNNAAA